MAPLGRESQDQGAPRGLRDQQEHPEHPATTASQAVEGKMATLEKMEFRDSQACQEILVPKETRVILEWANLVPPVLPGHRVDPTHPDP